MDAQTAIDGIDFSGESFVVRAALIGTDYVLTTSTGAALLRAERRFFEGAFGYRYYEEGDDEPRFRYDDASENGLNRFELVDESTGEALATIERDAEDSRYRWRLETGGESTRLLIVGEPSPIPVLDPQRGRHMSIYDESGTQIGSVDRRLLAIHFTFDVELTETSEDAKVAAVLAVPLLYDAMQKRPTAWDRE